jgi:hypothetical protein
MAALGRKPTLQGNPWLRYLHVGYVPIAAVLAFGVQKKADISNAAVMGLGELAGFLQFFCEKGESLPISQFTALLSLFVSIN